MDNKIRNKNIILAIVVLLVGFLFAGGTYAYLTRTVNVTNGNINVVSTCFDIDYIDTNQVTGTLFPSAVPNKGIMGKVSLKVNSACDLNGTGRIYLHVNSNNTSNKLCTYLPYYLCLNRKTLEYVSEYSSGTTYDANKKSGCIANENYRYYMNTYPMKFAVYDNSAGTGTPLSTGFIENVCNSDSDVLLYDDFEITHTQSDYYIFLWLDGNLTDNTYTNLTFNGYIKATATQEKYYSLETPTFPSSDYQKVEYLQSDGNQYIDTNINAKNNNGIYARFKLLNLDRTHNLFGVYSGNMNLTRMYAYYGKTKKLFYFGFEAGSTKEANSNLNVNTTQINYLNDRQIKFNNQVIDNNIVTTIDDSNNSNNIYIFGFIYGSIGLVKGSMQLYEFKVSEGSHVVADFVPCYRKSDNVPGLYDVIGGEFYTNQGTGTFTVGPDVNS